MAQTRAAIAQHWAERLCWQAARRDDARVARRLSRKPVVDGVYQVDEGALLEDCLSGLHELGVVDWLKHVQGTAVQPEMVPFGQDCPALQPEALVGHREHERAASSAVP